MGSTSNIPFMPGGFDDAEMEKIFCFSDNNQPSLNEMEKEEEKYLNFTGIIIIKFLNIF